MLVQQTKIRKKNGTRKMPCSNSNYFKKMSTKPKLFSLFLSKEMVQVSIYEHSEICSQEMIKLQ